jgi:tetratricopeptide (TPR) repeat protein
MSKSVRLTVVAVVAAALMTGCGGGGSKPNAKVSLETLNAGLKAQVAGHYGTAQKAYRDVLAGDPNNKYAYYNLGLIAQTEQRAADAENDYRKTLSIDPKFIPAMFNLAILRTNAKATPEAVNLYQQILAINDRQAGAHLNLGFLLRSTGQADAGNVHIARALELDPSLARRNTPVTGGTSTNG